MTGAGSEIHVVHIFDDNFWAPTYATMRSICLATKRRRDLVFHLLCFGLSAEHTADLDKIIEEFGARLHYVALDANALDAALVARLPKNSKRLAPVLYARLLLDELLPQEVSRFIYADSDMMFRVSIAPLWDIDLTGFPLAAVQDPYSRSIPGRRKIRDFPGLLDPSVPYFNSGLMVIDRVGWRAVDPAATLNRLIEEDMLKRLYYDQDVLNIAFRDNWLKLHNPWNFLNPRPEHESLNPRVAHYTGSHKPWRLRSRAAYARLYRHVMTNDLYYRYLRHRWRNFWLGRRVERP